MEYHLTFKAAAAKDLYKLTKKNRELGKLLVHEQIPEIMQDPLKGRSKQGDLKDIRSWDFGFCNVTYRILYQVDGATVRIYTIGAHDVAYRKAKTRK